MRQITVLFFALLLLASCRHVTGSGNIISEKKGVENFTAIDAGSAFAVEVKIGSPLSVLIEADDNLMKYIEAKVEGNTLKLHSKNGLSITDGHFKAYVTVPALDNIESSGAATVNVLDELKNSKRIWLHASGAGKITAQVDAPEINVESSGAANIKLSGKTKDISAHASGAAGIQAAELQSENAVAHASGAANVHVYASVKVTGDASGAGKVYYKGGATNVAVDESGAGKVKKED